MSMSSPPRKALRRVIPIRSSGPIEEGGDLEVCSFETAYKKGEFVPEFTLSHEYFSKYLDARDVYDLPIKMAFISLEKKAVILVGNDKPDGNYICDIFERLASGGNDALAAARDLRSLPESGKAVLISNDGHKKEVLFDEFCYKRIPSPFSDRVVFVEHGRKLEAYSADDLTLLGSSERFLRPRDLFLPSGRVIYEAEGGVCVTDSSPFSAIFKNKAR